MSKDESVNTASIGEGSEAGMTCVPSGANKDGCPLPDDKFVEVGRCQSAGCPITLCYQTRGNPAHPCLLFVSGLGATSRYWDDAFFDKLVQEQFYVVCFDNRDVGLTTHLHDIKPRSIYAVVLPQCLDCLFCCCASSSSPSRPSQRGGGNPPYYTLDDMARDAWGLLDQLGIRRATLMGASMGGMIVQCMAIQFPDRVRGLCIVYSHSGGPNVKRQTLRQAMSFLNSSKSRSPEDVMSYEVQYTKTFTSSYYPFDEQRLRARIERDMARAPEDAAGVLRQVWAVSRAASRVEGLRQLRGIPVLIIHGAEDTTIPWENGKELARLMEGSKLVVFPLMGHSVPPDVYGAIMAELRLLREHE